MNYESIRAGIDGQEVIRRMRDLYRIMKSAIETGLKGTRFRDRLLGAQSPGYRQNMNAGKLVGGEALHNITLYVSALMEVNSSMGTIVAAPTAGSCGTFPGAVLGVADETDLQACVSGTRGELDGAALTDHG